MKDSVRSLKYQKQIWYKPDDIKEVYGVFVCPGYDVYGNEYRILWEVDGNHYKIKDVWRYDAKCGTWCRW